MCNCFDGVAPSIPHTTILGTSYDLMDRQARNLITGVQPSTKLILGGDWSIDRFNLNLALTRYGSYKEVNVSAEDRRGFLVVEDLGLVPVERGGPLQGAELAEVLVSC